MSEENQVKAEASPAIANEEERPGLLDFLEDKDNRRLKYAEICVLIFSWITLAIMIAATQQTLEDAPYSPIAGLMIVTAILFWVLSFWEFTFFVIFTRRLMNKREVTMQSLRKKSGLKWFWKNVLFTWTCCLRTIAYIGSFIMVWLIVAFIFQETFFPTTKLEIYRIAAVSDQTATIFVRNPAVTLASVNIRVQGSNGNFVKSNGTDLTSATDFTGFVKVTGLLPDTVYEWKLDYQDDTIPLNTFKTAPTLGTKANYTFLFGSCFMYNFPAFLGSTAYRDMEAMNPDFYVFMGDLIYADVPVLLSKGEGAYREDYRQIFRNKHFASFSKKVPSFYMWDDHEVFNDFDLDTAPPYEVAIAGPWAEYVGNGNPQSSFTPNVFYFDFDYGDSSFFVLDTRTFRSENTETDSANYTILGSKQKADLFAWLLLKNTTATFKFLVSPVGWTADFPVDVDSWGSRKIERNSIFQFIKDNAISGCIFLSGDSHFAYAIELWYPGSGLYEFSASPIDAFDWFLGGYAPYSPDPFKPALNRTENLLFVDTLGVGSVSVIGELLVDTISIPPRVTVNFWSRQKLTKNITLTLDQTIPK